MVAHGTAAQIGQRMLVQLGWTHRTLPALFMEAIRRYRHSTPSRCTLFPFLASSQNPLDVTAFISDNPWYSLEAHVCGLPKGPCGKSVGSMWAAS